MVIIIKTLEISQKNVVSRFEEKIKSLCPLLELAG